MEKIEIFFKPDCGKKREFDADTPFTLHPAGIIINQKGKNWSYLIPYTSIKEAKIPVKIALMPSKIATPQPQPKIIIGR